MVSAKCQPFCSGLNELTEVQISIAGWRVLCVKPDNFTSRLDGYTIQT